MFIKKITIERILIVLGSLSVLPFIILSFYNHPSSGDDYCFANISMRLGLFKTVMYWYNGWSGCLFSTLLISMNPLVYHWWFGYKIIAAVFIIFIVICSWFLVRAIYSGAFSSTDKLAVAGGFLFLFFLKIPSVFNELYWMTCIIGYQLGFILILLFLSTLFLVYNSDKKLLYGLLNILLCVLIMHVNETYAVITVGALAMFFVLNFYSNKKADYYLLGLFGVSIVTFLLIYFAPGTNGRGQHFPLRYNLYFTIETSVICAFRVLKDALPTLFLLTILLLPVLIRLNSSRTHKPALLRLHPMLALAVILIFSIVAFIPTCWSTGLSPAMGRIQNTSFSYLILAWGFFMICLADYVSAHQKGFADTKRYVQLRWCALILLVCSMAIPNNFRMALGDLALGRAKGYDLQMIQRYEMISTSKSDTCVVPRLKNTPACIFMWDINTDPGDYNNKEVATYFHKKAVMLAK